LQQRLKSLSTELVTLRNRLHVTGGNSTLPNIPSSNLASPPINPGAGKIHVRKSENRDRNFDIFLFF
jgi:hypothetical protein